MIPFSSTSIPCWLQCYRGLNPSNNYLLMLPYPRFDDLWNSLAYYRCTTCYNNFESGPDCNTHRSPAAHCYFLSLVAPGAMGKAKSPSLAALIALLLNGQLAPRTVPCRWLRSGTCSSCVWPPSPAPCLPSESPVPISLCISLIEEPCPNACITCGNAATASPAILCNWHQLKSLDKIETKQFEMLNIMVKRWDFILWSWTDLYLSGQPLQLKWYVIVLDSRIKIK